MYHMTARPDVQDRAYAEVRAAFPSGVVEACKDDTLENASDVLQERLPFCRAIFTETLRVRAPVPVQLAVSTKPVNVCSYDFPEVRLVSQYRSAAHALSLIHI